MAQVESLGIKRLESVHYYVHDLERSRRFYTEVMDFAEIGESSDELTTRGRQKSIAFLAGNCVVVCVEPRGEGGRAWRWLRKHPDGVGTLIFEVEDVDETFRLLEGRGGTPIDDVRRYTDDAGHEIAFFSITTPFGDTTFRFVERHGYRALYPGFEMHERPRGGANRLGFVGFDHTTSNFPTLGHVALWLEHVMGFERFWEIQFHTTDVDPSHQKGSGLRSVRSCSVRETLSARHAFGESGSVAVCDKSAFSGPQASLPSKNRQNVSTRITKMQKDLPKASLISTESRSTSKTSRRTSSFLTSRILAKHRQRSSQN